MKAAAIICGVLVMAMSVAHIAYTLRRWHPSKRHVVAGATSLFFMGALLAFTVAIPPHIVTQITQASLLAAAVAFFILEIRLSPMDRRMAARSFFSLAVELVQEHDQRWIAEVQGLPGVAAYGNTPAEAKTKAQALALRLVADRLEQGEADPDILFISFSTA